MASTVSSGWSPSFCAGVNKLASIPDVEEYILRSAAVSRIKALVGSGQDSLSGGQVEKDDALGAVCLMAFLQANWTGPSLPASLPDLCRREALEALQLDGEVCYPLVKFPWLLVLSQRLLSNPWWVCRAAHAHQRLLDNPAPTIVALLESTLTEDAAETWSREHGGAELLVEAALMMQTIGNQGRSEIFLERASARSGFMHSLTGLPGRRTKFQSFDVVQLTVKCQEEEGKDHCSVVPTGDSRLPQSVALNDEYLLDGPSLSGGGGDAMQGPARLSPVGQSILLAEGTHVLRFYAKDSTVTEKILALLHRVLENPGNWCLYSSALFLRSQLEAPKSRFVERSALQYQALVDQISQMPETSFAHRATHLFACPLPPEWELDRAQGRLFAALGAYRTAAAIFERREMWDEHIACLIQLGERQAAEDLLNGRLRERPRDSKLLCILGELKDDPALYEKAWEVSGGRFGRAMRSLGMHYIKNDRIAEAIVCFEKALAINGLFEKIWFLLGCSAMQMEDWPKALHAFSRVVALDADHSEGWNNLAAAHLHMGRQAEALRCLKQAGRCQHDNARIWENVFRVAMAMGEIMEALAAYRRLCEIKEGETPLEGLHMILQTLRAAVQVQGPADPMVKSVMRQTAALLDTVMATHLSLNPQFWLACAEYARITQQPLEVVEFYFKAYRAMPTDSVEHDAQALSRLGTCVQGLYDALEGIKGHPEYPERRYQLVTILQNLLQRTKANHAQDGAIFTQLQELARMLALPDEGAQ